MTMNVLQTMAEIDTARARLVERGLSALSPWPRELLRKLRLDRSPSVGDRVKSWDILKTVDFIAKHLPKQAAILDIGAYASEILVALHRLDYRSLTGVDLNPRVKRMLYADSIRYEVADFLQTPFAAASFDAITSISVIEHGFRSSALLSEATRLLRPGGYFIASFDYWPQKLDTSGIQFFGMDWIIFSDADIRQFIAQAAEHGLAPLGPIDSNASERPISCAGKSYTFGWLVLQKQA